MSSVELEAYDKYWDIVRTERALWIGAHEEGEQIGLEKGEQLGVLRTALKMLRRNLDMEIVKEITGLSDGSIAKLQLLLETHGDQAEDHLAL